MCSLYRGNPMYSDVQTPEHTSNFYLGQQSVDKFKELFARFLEPDSTGKTWVLHTSQSQWVEANEETSLDWMLKSEMVVIDSGNDSGDNWKYTYFPKLKKGLFTDELYLLESFDGNF